MLVRTFLSVVLISCYVVQIYGFANDQCGITKTCYSDPVDCHPNTPDCRFYSWQKISDDRYYFEMGGGLGYGEQYIALALGTMEAMQDADLYYCDGIEFGTGVIQNSHQMPTYTTNLTGDLHWVYKATGNGAILCSFSRPASITKNISDGVSKIFDIENEEFYLLGAVGPMDGPEIKYHTIWKTVTENTFNFSKLDNVVNDDGCGSTKTCFKDPVNCVIGDADCRFFSWKKIMQEAEYDDLWEFEMVGGTGNGEQYIAMALGIEEKMANADLYYCDGTAVRSGVIQDSHDPPAYYEMEGALVTKVATTTNGIAQCIFSRPASVVRTIGNKISKDFDITTEMFYLLGAIGPMNGTEIRKHDTWRMVTNSTHNFGGSEIVSNPLNDIGCGETKTCFKDPTDCTVGSNDCRFYSWSKTDGSKTYDFEMSGGMGNGQEYVAFALGTTNSMQDADLYYCDGMTIRSGVIQTLHQKPAYMSYGLEIISARTIDGVAHCVMRRQVSVEKEISNGIEKDFNLRTENYYFLAAVGGMNGTGVQKHTWASVTDDRVVAFSSAIHVQMWNSCLLGFLAMMITISPDYFTY